MKIRWRSGSKIRHLRMDLGSKMAITTMRRQLLNQASKTPVFHSSIRLATMQLQAGQMDSSEEVKIQIERLKVDLVTLL